MRRLTTCAVADVSSHRGNRLLNVRNLEMRLFLRISKFCPLIPLAHHKDHAPMMYAPIPRLCGWPMPAHIALDSSRCLVSLFCPFATSKVFNTCAKLQTVHAAACGSLAVCPLLSRTATSCISSRRSSKQPLRALRCGTLPLAEAGCTRYACSPFVYLPDLLGCLPQAGYPSLLLPCNSRRGQDTAAFNQSIGDHSPAATTDCQHLAP